MSSKLSVELQGVFMSTDSRAIKARQQWIKVYEELGSVSQAARRCGIPRSTLYRWVNRIKDDGLESLKGRSKRPHNLANQKVDQKLITLIKSIRTEFKFGPKSISVHLLRNHGLKISSSTIWRVLQNEHCPKIKRYRKVDKTHRYSKAIPGERVQIDVTKIGPKCYQFTAIDDCTRLRVLRLYPNKKAESSVNFLGQILDSFEFPVQRIQTDWGTEFFNDLFQEELGVHFIKYRPIKPRSPHLNGKVERSQLTDKAEFYSTILKAERNMNLVGKLKEWEFFYNRKRPHSSLNGKTPYERYLEAEKITPIQPDVTSKYWEKEHDIFPRNVKTFYRKKRT